MARSRSESGGIDTGNEGARDIVIGDCRSDASRRSQLSLEEMYGDGAAFTALIIPSPPKRTGRVA